MKKKVDKKEKRNISIMREKFIVEYCKKIGWNHRELTTGQMLHIVTQSEYKSPKI